MSSQISIAGLPSEDRNLHLTFDAGTILLNDQRMVLVHTHTMGALRKELMDTLGIDRARGVLTRMGYASGAKDAELARKLLPESTDEELLMMGPRLHTLEGVVHVKPIKIDIDIRQRHYYGEFLWENSHEAEEHLKLFGIHPEPVCWTQIGYASGYTSEIVGRFIAYREVDCRAKGDRHCRIVGRPIEEWENADEERRYYRPDPMAEQLLALQDEVNHLRDSLQEETGIGDMVGASQAFIQACDMLRKVADSHVTVLLLGETGVGKEMFARALHSISPLEKNPFIAINCATIPDELIESELFGVEKGAYTGAQQSRPGRFERAHGGTLFLDEVGELSMNAQAKLLRVLQEGEIERVGDTRTRKVDVRVVAATNVDLQEAVSAGRFRSDLYYRLNIYPVIIPPLRERKDDIELLVNRFLEKYTARHGKRVNAITDKALQALKDYDWPGNIRELENMIERGVIIVSPGDAIDLKDLFPCLSMSQDVPLFNSQNETEDGGVESLASQVIDQSTSLEEMETLLLETAVKKANGNLSQAARILGITRPQLAYRLKKREP
ncbi:MAG: sigma 54-interacting transcriptional regulator [gamma proteobacterium symbiont of Ctena orbiculata]|nr:sigma 54-interacting transcriptional regulator [Candidatus Thiodiazotropha taylori]MBT3060011.1 sigma 54-interacting transcriptional regulator [Candidatus Thiodiazotropha sp. (ex Lucina pensylvanica)]MBT3063050.1 sigma 54-interacting transcriptional regulator [Candidatus Thiodiazotropha sp. (ex Lucina pensylvanica)]PUB72969.1 MAG: sigma-54-dependent Fis family transcriptional regulator [gamma proteobacterium symbiont of Ctena orbiculata]PUB79628.1 MAG: sigma-54-dependent Fis family transcrip